MLDIKNYISRFEDVLAKPSPVFAEWVKIRERMIVHTRGVKPTKLIDQRRPQEPDDIKNYRIANHRAITKDGINHGIDSVQRTLISSNYVITPAPSTEKFIKEKRFSVFEDEAVYEPLPFKQLIIEHLSRIKYDDPNGFLVWMPVHPTDKNKIPLETSPTEKIDIEPYIVDSYRVRDVSIEHLTFEALKKWKWEYLDYQNKKNFREDAYYFVITKEAIYRLLPYWDKAAKKVKYKEEVYYDMGLSEQGTDKQKSFKFLPAKVLGGNLTMNEKNEKFFESFFQSYAEFGDECIMAFQDDVAVRTRTAFPFISAKGDKCPTCKGAKKIQSEEGSKVTCHTCHGEGNIISLSPYGIHYRKEPANNDNPEWTKAPFVTFDSPDINILDFSFKAWQRFLELAKESINLVFTKEAQSGVAKEIDREEKTDMLFKISNNDFDLIKFSLDCIEAYLEPFASARKANVVIPPTTFQIKSQFTLVEELKQMMDSDAPQPFIITTSNQIAEKIYGGDVRQKKIVEVLSVWDVLFAMDDSDITQLKNTSAVQTKDIIRHIHGYAILYVMSQNAKFVTQTISEIIALAEAELVKLVPVEIDIVTPEIKEDEPL